MQGVSIAYLSSAADSGRSAAGPGPQQQVPDVGYWFARASDLTPAPIRARVSWLDWTPEGQQESAHIREGVSAFVTSKIASATPLGALSRV